MRSANHNMYFEHLYWEVFLNLLMNETLSSDINCRSLRTCKSCLLASDGKFLVIDSLYDKDATKLTCSLKMKHAAIHAQ